MIQNFYPFFVLHTNHSTYAFRVMESGHLEHLYYGRRITVTEAKDAELLTEKHVFAPSNTNVYDEKHNSFSLEDVCLEMSSYGRGDIREPLIEVVHGDGSITSDFRFEDATITRGKAEFKTLPGSYDETGQVQHLKVSLKDRQYDLLLELHYYVYEDCDVITRCTRLVNESGETVQLHRLLSAQLDFDTPEYVFTTFHGAWAREMKRTDVRMSAGKHVSASYTGTSSNRANPFVMLSKETTSEDSGDCFGCNLIYSGNHYEAVEVSGHGKTRFVTGVNPQSFCYQLAPGEDFEAPEAVMAYSHKGFNGMSQCMHHFVREHIVRGEWKHKMRPVLLNSWEAAYFDIDEEKLLNLARAGKEAGIELFVMDDGWFGNRVDDTQSLGDWQVDTNKLPHGVEGLSRKIKEMGLDFGIWVEPEMVNVKSNLYEQHPEWVLQIPGKPHSEGRTQRILDLTRQEVQEYIIEEMSRVFSCGEISYVKWDMNRTFTDYYSSGLQPGQQGEVAHRYVLGLYRCMKILSERFPKILFEGCCAGGNRFDLGILCYFPQIWASDDTDALCRAEIQTGYSYGYPMSVLGAHISACPNHQTRRITPLKTRFHVACFGVCGYECNFCEMTEKELEDVKGQIAFYKEWRQLLQTGDFYRGRTFTGQTSDGSCLMLSRGNITEWTCVSKDRKQAVGLLLQKLVAPNTQYEYYRARGLAPALKYRLMSGVQSAKENGETEECLAYGDALMYGGVKLKQAFSEGEHRGDMRIVGDFVSEIYRMVSV